MPGSDEITQHHEWGERDVPRAAHASGLCACSNADRYGPRASGRRDAFDLQLVGCKERPNERELIVDLRILGRVIEISREAYAQMVGAALDAYPLEACGLIAGPGGAGGGAGDRAPLYYPCTNIAESARVYTIDPIDHLRAERDADDRDLEINGVVHSHTHSEPYPSPTDVASAPDPSWHYVIISLKREAPEARSYRIVDGQITEEPIAIV